MSGPGNDLVVNELTKTFSGEGVDVTILDHVSLTVRAAETVAIIGPSGSGKSTLLNIIGALEPPTSGNIQLGEIEVTRLRGNALADFRASRVGFVFQEHHLLPQLTAIENVLLPTLAAHDNNDNQTEARAIDLLERIGLTARRNAFPAQMSGGERQRVALARALINGATLLLCDEPTGNLDRHTGDTVIDLLLELAEQQAVTVLMVTHNSEQAKRFDRQMVLRDGALVAANPGERDDT